MRLYNILLSTLLKSTPANTKGLFNVNPYDPLFTKNSGFMVRDGISLQDSYDNDNLLQDIERAHSVSENSYGSLRLLNWNVYTENYSSQNNSILQFLETNFKTAHPSIVALQGLRDSLLSRVNSILTQGGEHYHVVNTQKFARDAANASKLFLPIIYDTQLLKLERSGYFKKKDGETYASYAIFSSLGRKFIVVNMDIYQVKETIEEAEYFKIIKDLRTSVETEKLPYVLMGGIGKPTKHIKDHIKTQEINVLEKDSHNGDFLKTTAHGRNGNKDNIERDYILLGEERNIFNVRSSRILSGRGMGNVAEHYPIEAVLSFKD